MDVQERSEIKTVKTPVKFDDSFYKELRTGMKQINILCAKVCNASASLLNYLDDGNQYTYTKFGDWDKKKIPIEDSLCALTVRKGGLFVISNVQEHAQTRHMFAHEERPIKFYAGVPVRNIRGDIIASLCVISYEPHSLSKDEKLSFLILAKHLETVMQVFETKNQELGSLQEELVNDLKQHEVMQLEINHRIKNNLADICGMIQLERAETKDPEVRDILSRTESRISTAIKLHELLYQSKNMAKINMREYIERLSQTLIEVSKPEKLSIDCEINVDELYPDFSSVFPLGLILNELLTNALQHAFGGRESGKIAIDLSKRSDDRLMLTVRDNGNGLKSSDKEITGVHLGRKIIELLATQLKAEINFYQDREGTLFKLSFIPETKTTGRKKRAQKKFTNNYLPVYS